MTSSSTSRDTVVIVASHQDAGDMEYLRNRLPMPVRACTVHEWVESAVWLPPVEQWAAYIDGIKLTFAQLHVDPGEGSEAYEREAPYQ